MIILLSKLNELLGEVLDINQASNALTMIGLEVEEIKEVSCSELSDKIVVGKILSIEDHPNADRLKLCKVDIGSETLSIVCGADNIKTNDLVPVAQVGTNFKHNNKFPEGLKIKKTKIRDVESFGMLCSSEELGLNYDSDNGIFILPLDVVIGSSLKSIKEIEDFILDISITPNRGDCLSYHGISRDLSAALRKDFQDPILNYNSKDKTRVAHLEGLSAIINSDEVLRYSLIKIENVEVKESPFWLKNFLAKMNMSSVNNVVDSTNLFMFLTGHPIHAFDLDEVKGNIVISNTVEGSLETLSDETKSTKGHLIVSDSEGPLAFAGIIGGKRSSVKKKTKNLLIECASFIPSTIRKSSKKLNISTDSSFRFERRVSEFRIDSALVFAASLIESVCGGNISSEYIDTFHDIEFKNKREPVKLNLSKVSKILGVQVKDSDIISILGSLSIKMLPKKDKDKSSSFVVPEYRFDLETDHDLIEEVARIRGLDSIPPILPQVSIRSKMKNPMQDLGEIVAKSREAFAAEGFSEVVNFSFSDDLNIFPDRKKVKIMNPLSQDAKFLRSTLLPSLLKNALYNFNHKDDVFKIFEIGNVFSEDENILQTMEIAAISSLSPSDLLWKKDSETFFDIKNSIFNYFKAINIDLDNINLTSSLDDSYSQLLHPGKSAIIQFNNVDLGFLGEIHPELLADYGIKKGLIAFSLSLSKAANCLAKDKRFNSYSSFPVVQRDLSLVLNKNIESKIILDLINTFDSSIVKESFVFDVFENPKLGDEKKSLSLSVLFGSSERTLEDSEVTKVLDDILIKIKKEVDVEIRG